MTVRDGMTSIIADLRGMTNAGTADYSIGAVTYWTDDQVQNIADRHAEDFFRIDVSPQLEYSGGAIVYKRYYLPVEGDYESGTAAFTVENGAGSVISPTLYTLDPLRRVVTFSSDTEGEVYYFTGRRIDMNAAASDIWQIKASYYANKFDFSTDNHNVKYSQVAAQCLKMAEKYANMSTGSNASIEMFRSDSV